MGRLCLCATLTLERERQVIAHFLERGNEIVGEGSDPQSVGRS
jgi:hypothetical protein